MLLWIIQAFSFSPIFHTTFETFNWKIIDLFSSNEKWFLHHYSPILEIAKYEAAEYYDGSSVSFLVSIFSLIKVNFETFSNVFFPQKTSTDIWD